MADRRRSVLIAVSVAALASVPAAARRFYPDDPIAKEPPPLSVGVLRRDAAADPARMIRDSLHQTGGRRNAEPALDTNTIDEVPDGPWFTNRHYVHRLSPAELKNGPNGAEPPSTDQPWMIYEATEGLSPVLRIEDSQGRRYGLRFDPKDCIELTTGADVVGSKIFHALGYNVPDNYAIRFTRAQVKVAPNVRFVRSGEKVTLRERDLDHLLSLAPRYSDGSWRALASRLVEGSLLGPFEYSGTRADDPNDIVPHEMQRVLRGLYVFSQWLDLTDTRALGTLDTIQPLDGVPAVRHYLTDFGSAFGAGALRPKEAWEGHTYAVDFRWGLKEMLTLGAYSPRWERTHATVPAAAGRYDGDGFDPRLWKPAFPNPAFDNRTPADCFWAAKQIAVFTDDDIRALVATGSYSDPRAIEALVRALIVRRDKIAGYYFTRTLPLDRFEVRDGELHFAIQGPAGRYTIHWVRFDNNSQTESPLDVAATFRVPNLEGYSAAHLSDGTHSLTVYVIDGRVVGISRSE